MPEETPFTMPTPFAKYITDDEAFATLENVDLAADLALSALAETTFTSTPTKFRYVPEGVSISFSAGALETRITKLTFNCLPLKTIFFSAAELAAVAPERTPENLDVIATPFFNALIEGYNSSPVKDQLNPDIVPTSGATPKAPSSNNW
jgi:hypothetical protein